MSYIAPVVWPPYFVHLRSLIQPWDNPVTHPSGDAYHTKLEAASAVFPYLDHGLIHYTDNIHLHEEFLN